MCAGYAGPLRDHAIQRLLSEVPYSRLNGSATKRLANNINISAVLTLLANQQ